MKNQLGITMKRVVAGAFWVVAGAIILGGGCTVSQELCDVRDECVHYSDRAYDDCVTNIDEVFAVASVYECDEEADAWAECIINDADCTQGAFDESDCAKEACELNQCECEASEYQDNCGSC